MFKEAREAPNLSMALCSMAPEVKLGGHRGTEQKPLFEERPGTQWPLVRVYRRDLWNRKWAELLRRRNADFR